MAAAIQSIPSASLDFLPFHRKHIEGEIEAGREICASLRISKEEAETCFKTIKSAADVCYHKISDMATGGVYYDNKRHHFFNDRCETLDDEHPNVIIGSRECVNSQLAIMRDYCIASLSRLSFNLVQGSDRLHVIRFITHKIDAGVKQESRFIDFSSLEKALGKIANGTFKTLTDKEAAKTVKRAAAEEQQRAGAAAAEAATAAAAAATAAATAAAAAPAPVMTPMSSPSTAPSAIAGGVEGRISLGIDASTPSSVPPLRGRISRLRQCINSFFAAIRDFFIQLGKKLFCCQASTTVR